MSDFRRGDDIRPWLEMELGRQLRPVTAPESLWDRVQHPRRRWPGTAPRLMLWPAITVILFAASCILVWQIGKARSTIPDMSHLTSRELQSLAHDSGGLDLRSDDPVEIRQWVRANADIDIKLPSGHREDLRLLGVRLIRTQGLSIAAIAYQVAGDRATLLVSKKPSGSGRTTLAGSTLAGNTETTGHQFTKIDSAGSPRLLSWNMPDQDYAIAWSGSRDAHVACQLCHADVSGLRPEPQL